MGGWYPFVPDARMMTVEAIYKEALCLHEGTFLKPDEQRDPGDCRAVSETLARIGDKWTVLVVELLRHGPMRFNELRRTINGISQRMLTLTLRGLERDGLVTRTVYPTIPPRVEYELTTLGRTLREPLGAIAEWARTHRPAIERAQKLFDAVHTGSTNVRRSPRRVPAIVRNSRPG
jgi:DNA-binding HxlR family transcriptional regulator